MSGADPNDAGGRDKSYEHRLGLRDDQASAARTRCVRSGPNVTAVPRRPGSAAELVSLMTGPAPPRLPAPRDPSRPPTGVAQRNSAGVFPRWMPDMRARSLARLQGRRRVRLVPQRGRCGLVHVHGIRQPIGGVDLDARQPSVGVRACLHPGLFDLVPVKVGLWRTPSAELLLARLRSGRARPRDIRSRCDMTRQQWKYLRPDRHARRSSAERLTRIEPA
jgi:hypothetical protein